MVSITKQQALRAANRPMFRETTLLGHRVRVRWWHDVLAGAVVIGMALAVTWLALAVL